MRQRKLTVSRKHFPTMTAAYIYFKKKFGNVSAKFMKVNTPDWTMQVNVVY